MPIFPIIKNKSTEKWINKLYVNNKQLYEAMKTYKAAVAEAKINDTQKPRIPEYVGQCLLLIAQRLSSKPYFSGYSFREEMVSDGIQNCIEYIDNFNPDKSTNPFAYFTQIIKFAFVRRIEREKKQAYIKVKNMHNSALHEVSEHSRSETDRRYDDLLVDAFEKKLTSKKKSGSVEPNDINPFFKKKPTKDVVTTE